MFAVLGLLALLFLASLSLVLFSVKEYVSDQAEFQNNLRKSEEEAFQESRIKGLEKEISMTNEELFKLHSFYESQPRFSAVLQKLAVVLPPDSYFTAINFKYLSLEEGIAITVQGFAPSREVLGQLKDGLEESFNIYEMRFPDVNWTRPDSFVIDLKINI